MSHRFVGHRYRQRLVFSWYQRHSKANDDGFFADIRPYGGVDTNLEDASGMVIPPKNRGDHK